MHYICYRESENFGDYLKELIAILMGMVLLLAATDYLLHRQDYFREGECVRLPAIRPP
jgi:hypothetical protein